MLAVTVLAGYLAVVTANKFVASAQMARLTSFVMESVSFDQASRHMTVTVRIDNKAKEEAVITDLRMSFYANGEFVFTSSEVSPVFTVPPGGSLPVTLRVTLEGYYAQRLGAGPLHWRGSGAANLIVPGVRQKIPLRVNVQKAAEAPTP
jgi:LEA14-like dessication related protein